MKILILGASEMGSAIAFDLARNKVEIGIADRALDTAEKIANKHNAEAIKINVKEDDRLIKLTKKYNTVKR